MTDKVLFAGKCVNQGKSRKSHEEEKIMQKITPFLMFNDRAGEAMEFYTSIFKDSKIVSTMPGPDGKVMGGSIEIEGQLINPDYALENWNGYLKTLE